MNSILIYEFANTNVILIIDKIEWQKCKIDDFIVQIYIHIKLQETKTKTIDLFYNVNKLLYQFINSIVINSYIRELVC